jgi:hypothetical protein
MAGKANKQELAVACLLSEPTVEAAAKKAGISYRTLKLWLTRPEFQALYRAARAEVTERNLARLLACTGEAIETLRRNLTCGEFGPENRAADLILSHAEKGTEIQDLRAELDEIKRQVAAMRKGDGDVEPAAGGRAAEGRDPQAVAAAGQGAEPDEPDAGP